jgi:chromosome segregation ATPase/predicted flap endonuclease-1-like 5' DNA nuclease
MNTYVMAEIAALLAITAVAGILIGWCIKSLFSGRFERQVRADVARDVDEAAADVQRLRTSLQEKDADLQGAMLELQQLRGRDVSLSAGNTTQVEEINDLKVQLSRARQTLDQNRAEFAAFRDEKLHELQSVSNELASFKTGGSHHDASLNQAHDSIAALRSAARENDKIIDSLRARNKEADTTIENLRSQLKQSETAKHEAIATRQEQERATARLTTNLQSVSTDLEKQKRDYSTMLENKNRDISKQMSRIEELGSVQTLLKQKEHDFDKLNNEMRETAGKTSAEISELKRKLEVSEQALADSRTGIKSLQDQVAELTRENKAKAEQHQSEIAKLSNQHSTEISELQKAVETSNRELQAVSSLKTQIENKDAEVVALNDMLRDISGKRDQTVDRIKTLESQLKNADALQQQVTKGEQQMEALASALKQREADYAKLRAEKDALDKQRSALETRVRDLEVNSSKLQEVSRELETLRPQKQVAEQAQSEVTRLTSLVGNYEGEINQLKTKAANADEQSKLVSNLQTALKQKDAEVQKLRTTGDSLSALNTQVNSLGATISQRDTDLADARLRVKNLTASLKERDSEIQLLRKTGEEQKKSQIEIDRLTAALAQRDSKLATLNSQIASLTEERSQATAEIQQIKSEQATEKSKLQSSDSQRAAAYKKLQTEFDKISTARDEYEVRVADLQRQLNEQQKSYDAQLKKSQQQLSDLQPQLGTLQTQVNSLTSEKQQLTADLSDTESYKLKLTERDAEIKKLQVELRDAQGSATLQTSLQDQTRKVDSLTSAMRERDNEINRLNKIITDNRVGSKQQSSEVNLLKDEIDSQKKLIRSLEDQAENTLQLHKKIATQSTEIESLRADLHLTRSKVQQPALQADHSHEIVQLKQQLSAYQNNATSSDQDSRQLQSEVDRLQRTLAQRDAELQQARADATAAQRATPGSAPAGSATTSNNQTTRVVGTRVSTQPTAKPTSSDKPRVFVRHGESHEAAMATQVETRQTETKPAATRQVQTRQVETRQVETRPAKSKPTHQADNTTSTAENLAGTQMPSGQSTATDSQTTTRRRALYTGDGYRLKRTDGTDDLALLPGFTNELADTLRKNKVTEFEQVALWTQREVAHFADRLGVGTAKAESLQWPNAAKEILAGRFRVDTYREAENN